MKNRDAGVFKLIKGVLWIMLIVLLSVLSLAQDMETSLISLIIYSGDQIIYQNDFYEIFDMGEYLLLPLGILDQFEIVKEYRREDSCLTVINKKSDTRVEIDLENKTYVNHSEWSQQVPMNYQGELYLGTFFFEEILQAQIEWNAKYQELIIRGEMGEYDDNELSKEKEDVTNQDLREKTDVNREVDISGPFFSIGTIQYDLSWVHKEEDRKAQPNGNLNLDVLGRVGDLAFSIGLKTNLNPEDSEAKIQKVNLKYSKNDHLLIIGKSKVNFSKTIGIQNIAGIYYTYPNSKYSRLVAYTEVTGAAENGDLVKLYVNGEFRDKLIVSESQYTFTRIPLKIYQINYLKITIQNNENEEVILEKSIAASPKILISGERYVTSILGTVGNSVSGFDDGVLVGAQGALGISNNISVNLEAVGVRGISSDNMIALGSDFEVAFRLGQNMILSLEWLVGGKKEVNQGVRSTLLWCLERGYIEGLLFYIPPETSSVIKALTGAGGEVFGLWNLTDRLVLTGDAYVSRPFDNQSQLSENYANLSSKLVFGRKINNLLSLNTELSKSFNDYLQIWNGKINTKHKVNTKKLAQELDLTYQFKYSEVNNFSYLNSEVQLEEKISNFITNNFAISNSIKTEGSMVNNEFEKTSIKISSKVKLGFGSLWLTGLVSGSAYSSVFTDYQIQLQKLQCGLYLRHYRDNNFLWASVANTLYNYDQTNITEGNVGGTHFLNNQEGTISWDLKYVWPIENQARPQLSASMYLNRELDQYLTLGFKFQRVYSSLWDYTPENIFTINLSHGLGFASGKVFGKKYSNFLNSVIMGTVYLDQNGNRLLDPEDRRLEGITMLLDGRRVRTNALGEFVFDFVKPGIYKLGFDAKTLDADYTVITPDQIVELKENENITYDFGVTFDGSISGRIYFDKNANGLLDDEEEPIEWVRLILNSIKEKEVFAKTDGTFYIENLALGEYVLEVDTATLPTNMMIKDVSSFTIKITEECLDVRDIMIPVVFKFH